jgi:hypothetical protein
MKRITLLLFALACAPYLQAAAETLDTNNPSIVVKRVYCVDYNVGGVLVNKGAQPFQGRLRVAVRDEEGDVVGRHSIRMRAGGATGARFEMYYINTLDCRRHSFEFTVE